MITATKKAIDAKLKRMLTLISEAHADAKRLDASDSPMWQRFSIVSHGLHDAMKLLHELEGDLDVWGRKKKAAEEAALRKAQLVLPAPKPPIVTPTRVVKVMQHKPQLLLPLQPEIIKEAYQGRKMSRDPEDFEDDDLDSDWVEGPRCESCDRDLDVDPCICGPAGPRINGVWTGENGAQLRQVNGRE